MTFNEYLSLIEKCDYCSYDDNYITILDKSGDLLYFGKIKFIYSNEFIMSLLDFDVINYSEFNNSCTDFSDFSVIIDFKSQIKSNVIFNVPSVVLEKLLPEKFKLEELKSSISDSFDIWTKFLIYDKNQNLLFRGKIKDICAKKIHSVNKISDYEFEKILESKIIGCNVYIDNPSIGVSTEYATILIKLDYTINPKYNKENKEEDNMDSKNKETTKTEDINLLQLLNKYSNEIINILDKNNNSIYHGFADNLIKLSDTLKENILLQYSDILKSNILLLYINKDGIFTIIIDYLVETKEEEIAKSIIYQIEKFLDKFNLKILPEKEDPAKSTDPGEDLPIIYGENYNTIKNNIIKDFQPFSDNQFVKKTSLTFGNIYNTLYKLYLDYILDPNNSSNQDISTFEYRKQISEKIVDLSFVISKVLEGFGIFVL